MRFNAVPDKILFIFSTILSVSFFIINSCGLETYVYLGPPTDVRSPTIAFLYSFENNPDNNKADFYGYELYYRFYPDGAEDIEEDIAFIETYGVPGITALKNRNFRRIASDSTVQSKPLITVDPANKGLSFEISVDFKGPTVPGATGDPVAEWNGNSIALRRSVESSPGQWENFLNADINSTDNDIPDTFIDGDTLTIVLFGLAYGVDGSNFNELYSVPVNLGTSDFQY